MVQKKYRLNICTSSKDLKIKLNEYENRNCQLRIVQTGWRRDAWRGAKINVAKSESCRRNQHVYMGYALPATGYRRPESYNRYRNGAKTRPEIFQSFSSSWAKYIGFRIGKAGVQTE